MKYSYMYVYTRMIFTAVLSPTIKIFHRHLGPNLSIFAVKVSPWFHRHFMVILWHITDISPRKNTDQGDFLLKCAVRAVAITGKFLILLFFAKSVIFKQRKKYILMGTYEIHKILVFAIYRRMKIILWKINSKFFPLIAIFIIHIPS